MNIEKMNSGKKRFALLTALAIAASILRCLMINAAIAMEIYGDELIYYSICKSLFYHTTIMVHGNPFSFHNIAYSVFLMPFMAISNSVIRFRVIMFANAFILSSCIFPVWVICKEIALEKKYCWMSVFIILLWPDLSMNATLMAENLYWPVFLWAIYMILKFMKTERLMYSILAGAFSYLAYFCKEVAVCIPLALICSYVIYCFISNRIFRHSEKINKICWSKLAAYYITYAGLLVLTKCFLFSGSANGGYASALGQNPITDIYSLLYMLYSYFYYLLAIILAFAILPVFYSVLLYKHLDELTKKLSLFSLIYLAGSALMIVFMISVKEDLGSVRPRIHLRYIAVLAAVLIPLFFKEVQTMRMLESRRKVEKSIFYVMCLYIICLMVLFKGPGWGVTIEHCSLAYYDMAEGHWGIMTSEKDNVYSFYLYVIVVHLFILFFVFFANYGIMKKNTIKYFIISTVIVNCINNYAVFNKIKSFHGVDSSMVAEMSRINDWFHANQMLQDNVLYIGDEDAFSKYRKIFDTYYDGTNIITVSDKSLRESLSLNENCTRVEEISFEDVLLAGSYDNVKDINYIIIDTSATSDFTLLDADEILELSGNTYRVWRNRNADNLKINF